MWSETVQQTFIERLCVVLSSCEWCKHAMLSISFRIGKIKSKVYWIYCSNDTHQKELVFQTNIAVHPFYSIIKLWQFDEIQPRKICSFGWNEKVLESYFEQRPSPQHQHSLAPFEDIFAHIHTERDKLHLKLNRDWLWFDGIAFWRRNKSHFYIYFIKAL